MHTTPAPWLSWLIPLVVIGIVLTLRIRGLSRSRRLRLETLWVLPALLFAGAVALLWEKPPTPAGWAWIAIAFVLGGGIGWKRGQMMAISVDPETHALNHRGSPAAIILIVALIAVRFAARGVMQAEMGAWHLNPILLSGIFGAMTVGVVAVQRLEMFLRARRLLGAARRAI